MTTVVCALLFVCVNGLAQTQPRTAKIRDLVTVEGVRENSLIGYGLVVGLNGTGDRSQTVFTTQSLSNVLQKMGVQVAPSAMRVNNIAAVIVTANLPMFARNGTKTDVTVSSIGDAKSLDGGLLLLTALRAADGQVYASAQGPVTLGGYSAGQRGNSKQVNHPTTARIPEGATVERNASVPMEGAQKVSLLLRRPSFTTARDVASRINESFGKHVASEVDARRIEVSMSLLEIGMPGAMARIEELTVPVQSQAKVVVNERTGTVAIGKDIRLAAVSILHGDLAVEVASEHHVSQPRPLATGETSVEMNTAVRVKESPARRIELDEGSTVEQLLNSLQTIGATARDVIAILQCLKEAGGLDAELEVI